MGNQQLSNLTIEDRIRFLAIEARFGDGTLWKHPECKNWKMIFSSTTPDLLEAKQKICPEVFTTGVKFMDCSSAKGRFANAKPMYRLASTVHPVITEVRAMDDLDLFPYLTMEMLALWYLDDGSAVLRNDGRRVRSYQFTLCVGSKCNTAEKEAAFLGRIAMLFPDLAATHQIGTLCFNSSTTSHTSMRNRVWRFPHTVAAILLPEARKYNACLYKCPTSFNQVKSSETIP